MKVLAWHIVYNIEIHTRCFLLCLFCHVNKLNIYVINQTRGICRKTRDDY